MSGMVSEMGQNCVVYTRYSSDRQREESIEGQIRVCEDYARRNGMEILHIYADRAMTGRSDQRPEFLQMIRDAASMSFDTVLVYKLNRFARNRYDSAKYKHKLKKYGVKVVSAMENIADDPSGILLESVIEGMAEYYSAELAENVVRGMTENALEGKWPGGVIPLGYKLDKSHHLVIDEPNAMVVKRIFKMLLEGRTPLSVCRTLNDEGKRTGTGKKFTRSTLTRIVNNERYRGVFYWKDVKRENGVPRIIDDKTFYSAQELMNNRRTHKNVIKRSENYLLTGKLFCGQCGCPMVGKSGTSKGGKIYYYYNCQKHLDGSGCISNPIRTDKLENLVVRVTTKILSSKEAVKAIARQAVELRKEKKESLEVQSLKAQISDLKKKLDNCLKAIDNGVSSEALYNHMGEYEKRLRELNCELSKAQLLDRGMELSERQIEAFFGAISQRLDEEPRYKEILLTSLVRSVIVYDDYVEIRYNYKKELPALSNPVRVESSHKDAVVTRMFVYANIKLKVCQSYFSIFTALAA